MVTGKESMCEAMRGCDGVFHIAAWYKIEERDKTPGQKINIEGTRNVLELIKELNIKKGVYTSTLARPLAKGLKEKLAYEMKELRIKYKR
ncbi:MAG: NAD-dependent epimerase/dehydratase family protein [Chitinophagales bacterium]